jgi:branched-subunit amino acid aminotransferase/4-amino-4-deoxychorismate lyase
MRYINYNGNIHDAHEPLLPVSNRGFRYGDGFFETMVMFDKKVPLLNYHFSRIEYTAQVLGAQIPKRFNIESFQNMLLDLALVNDSAINARVRLQFFRKGDGLYLPEEDELGYTFSLDKIENTKFETGDGLKVGMRDDCWKPVSMVSDLKSSNALMYVLAAQLARKEGWDECILLNDSESISEAIHSNVFLVKGEKIITPHLDSGCVNGVMRAYVISMLDDANFEEREVDAKELEEADEILLTNAVRGIHWVREFNGKVYTNKKAVELTASLNKELLQTN